MDPPALLVSPPLALLLVSAVASVQEVCVPAAMASREARGKISGRCPAVKVESSAWGAAKVFCSRQHGQGRSGPQVCHHGTTYRYRLCFACPPARTARNNACVRALVASRSRTATIDPAEHTAIASWPLYPHGAPSARPALPCRSSSVGLAWQPVRWRSAGRCKRCWRRWTSPAIRARPATPATSAARARET